MNIAVTFKKYIIDFAASFPTMYNTGYFKYCCLCKPIKSYTCCKIFLYKKVKLFVTIIALLFFQIYTSRKIKYLYTISVYYNV